MHLSKGHVMDGDESSLIQLANGSLLLSIRPAIGSKCHCRAVSRSDDGGLSWSNMAWVPELISSRCQGSMMRYAFIKISLFLYHKRLKKQ